MDKEEKTLKENLIYDGRIIKVYSDDVLCPNGNKSKREYIKHNGGVCILAIKDGFIYFERQFRYPYHKELLELPAGKLEKGEDPKEAAVRELKEEAGISADKLELVAVLSGDEYYFEYPNGDKMCTVIVLFKVLNYTGEIKVSDNESKQLKFFSLDALPNMESRAKVIIDKINNGQIKI